MGTRDKRVDTYIARSADFARPILGHIRKLVHKACPGVEETMKWSFPHFDCRGMMCSMASFKHHCAFGFWKAQLLNDHSGVLAAAGTAMGHLGRITRKEDLPSDAVLTGLIRQAARLNEEGVKAPRNPRPRTGGKPRPPAWFLAALRKNRKALETFRNFSPSHQREYIEWVTEAKREDTRGKRLASTIEWLSRGKSRNWKYERTRRQGIS